MFYNEKFEARKPLVFATIPQLENEKVLHRIKHAAKHVLQWAVEDPQALFAVTCEEKVLRTKVNKLLLGTYHTRAQVEREDMTRPFYEVTPEPDVYYRPLIQGSPTGLVDMHTTRYVERLVANGAVELDGFALVRDSTYLEEVLSNNQPVLNSSL